jgi:hypothetical protein
MRIVLPSLFTETERFHCRSVGQFTTRSQGYELRQVETLAPSLLSPATGEMQEGDLSILVAACRGSFFVANFFLRALRVRLYLA